MVEDRFFSAVARVVRRVLNDTAEIDFRALYPARVVEWTSSDVFPSGLVGVVFVSDDVGRAATRLVSKKGVPVLPPVPGMSYEPRPGTQCLVGWQGGDERFPYATGWLGLGGMDSMTQDVGTVYTHTGPLVDVVGDLRSEHELGRMVGVGPVATPSPPVVPVAVAVGDDTSFDVTFTIGNGQTLLGGAPICTVTLGRAYPTPPRVVASAKLWPLPTNTGAFAATATSGQTITISYAGPVLPPLVGPLAGLALTCFVRG